MLNTMLKKEGSAGLAQKSAMVHFRLSFCRRRPFNYFLCCLILHRGHHCSASRDLQLILPTFSSSVTSYITSYQVMTPTSMILHCNPTMQHALLEEGKLSEIQKYTNGEIQKIQKGQWRPVQARRDLIRR